MSGQDRSRPVRPVSTPARPPAEVSQSMLSSIRAALDIDTDSSTRAVAVPDPAPPVPLTVATPRRRSLSEVMAGVNHVARCAAVALVLLLVLRLALRHF